MTKRQLKYYFLTLILVGTVVLMALDKEGWGWLIWIATIVIITNED